MPHDNIKYDRIRQDEEHKNKDWDGDDGDHEQHYKQYYHAQTGRIHCVLRTLKSFAVDNDDDKKHNNTNNKSNKPTTTKQKASETVVTFSLQNPQVHYSMTKANDTEQEAKEDLILCAHRPTNHSPFLQSMTNQLLGRRRDHNDEHHHPDLNNKIKYVITAKRTTRHRTKSTTTSTTVATTDTADATSKTFADDSNDDGDDDGNSNPCCHRFNNTANDDHDDVVIGYLVEVQSTFSCHVYAVLEETESASITHSISAPTTTTNRTTSNNDHQNGTFAKKKDTCAETRSLNTVAYILYDVPSMLSILDRGMQRPPRRGQMSIFPKNMINKYSATANAMFDDVCQTSIAKVGRLPYRISATAKNMQNATGTVTKASASSDDSFDDRTITSTTEEAMTKKHDGHNHSVTNCDFVLLESLDPYVKPNGNLGLNFHGRGKGSSPKNMQLVMSAGSSSSSSSSLSQGKKNVRHGIHLQMAKWDDSKSTNPKTRKNQKNNDDDNLTKVYHVDYKHPITPLQAFGFALAQLDL